MSENIKVVQGSNREFSVRVVEQPAGTPMDLTGVAVTDIVAEFVKSDGTCLSLTGATSIVIESALGGKIKIVMTTANTAALKLGVSQAFQLKITKAAKLNIVRLEKALDVLAQVC